jgi:hypothetical protein
MHLYFGLVAWGVAAFVIYKAINIVLTRRQLSRKSSEVEHNSIAPA